MSYQRINVLLVPMFLLFQGVGWELIIGNSSSSHETYFSPGIVSNSLLLSMSTNIQWYANCMYYKWISKVSCIFFCWVLSKKIQLKGYPINTLKCIYWYKEHVIFDVTKWKVRTFFWFIFSRFLGWPAKSANEVD